MGKNSHTTQCYRVSSEMQSIIPTSSFQGKVFHTHRLHTLTAKTPLTSVNCCRTTALHKKKSVCYSHSKTQKYSRQPVIFIVMATKRGSYTVVNCKTSKWQVILAATSTTGQNVINTSHTLVILTASYAHKPHDFSALVHRLTVTHFFNLYSYSF